jgi:hypothetical protein
LQRNTSFAFPKLVCRLEKSGFLQAKIHKNYTKIKKGSGEESPKPLVPLAGLEPARYCYQRILSPQRLPFRHKGTLPLYSSKSPSACPAFLTISLENARNLPPLDTVAREKAL